jgi:imidazoleglycerol-phosphate dehydratase
MAGFDSFFADRVVRVKSRRAKVRRRTAETDIRAEFNLDGQGRYQISTGIRFLDHMLELFTRHGGFDLSLAAKGDLDVDQHHTVEDVGLVLGEVLRQALGDKKGINRAGYFVMPMDETLGLAAVDLSGRPYLVMKGSIKARLVGDLKTELLEDFFQGFVSGARANLHLKVAYGRSSHHAVESLFKAFARALRYACSRDTRLKQQLPSTKGLL